MSDNQRTPLELIGVKSFGEPENKYDFWQVKIWKQEGVGQKGPWGKVVARYGRPYKNKDGYDCLTSSISSWEFQKKNCKEARQFMEQVLASEKPILEGQVDLHLDKPVEAPPVVNPFEKTEPTPEPKTLANPVSFDSDTIPTFDDQDVPF